MPKKNITIYNNAINLESEKFYIKENFPTKKTILFYFYFSIIIIS